MIDLTKSADIDIKINGGESINAELSIFEENDPTTEADDTAYSLASYVTIEMKIGSLTLSTANGGIVKNASSINLVMTSSKSNLPKLSHSYSITGIKADATKKVLAKGLFIVV